MTATESPPKSKRGGKRAGAGMIRIPIWLINLGWRVPVWLLSAETRREFRRVRGDGYSWSWMKANVWSGRYYILLRRIAVRSGYQPFEMNDRGTIRIVHWRRWMIS